MRRWHAGDDLVTNIGHDVAEFFEAPVNSIRPTFRFHEERALSFIPTDVGGDDLNRLVIREVMVFPMDDARLIERDV